MNEKNHAKSIELLTQAKHVAQGNQWYRQMFLAYNNIGANYYMLLDYGEALDNYLEAYKIALQHLDAKHEMIVLNNIAILYSKEKKFNKSEEYFLKAYELATASKDSLKIGMYAVNLATVANEKKETPKSEKYIAQALELSHKYPSIENLVKVAQANHLMLKGEYEAAKSIGLALISKLQAPELSQQRISNYMILSSIYEHEKKYDQAIEMVQRAKTDEYASLENVMDSFEQLSRLYRLKNDFNSAFAYKDSVVWTKDSLNQIKNGKLFENSQIKFELQKSQNELSISQENLKRERRTFYITLTVSIVFIFLLLWALRNYAIKLKQRKIIAERNQKIMELELEKEKSFAQQLEEKYKESEAISYLEKERLKMELESKNRQLASKALSVSMRNELIEEVVNAISAESMFSRNKELKRKIVELKTHLKKDSGKEEFFTHFEEINNGFLSALRAKHPELNANDIRFLSYIYMNLTTKEIASILNITFEACKKRKSRIIRKMNLPENVDIYSYLSNI